MYNKELRSHETNTGTCLEKVHGEHMHAISEGNYGVMMDYLAICVKSLLKKDSSNCDELAEKAIDICTESGMNIVKEYMDLRKALFDAFVANKE